MDTPKSDDGDSISGDQLQSDETYEESDESSYDYEVVPDSEEEALLMNVAIEASHKTARLEAQRRSGAGPSTSKAPTTSRAAMRVMHIVESDEEIYAASAQFSGSDGSELSTESLDDEPVTKTRGKAKAKVKKEKSNDFIDSWSERVYQRRLARRERSERRKEERLLAQRLGRRLTFVCPRFMDQTVVCSTHVLGGENFPSIEQAPSRT